MGGKDAMALSEQKPHEWYIKIVWGLKKDGHCAIFQ
jgi:hypothetical protein